MICTILIQVSDRRRAPEMAQSAMLPTSEREEKKSVAPPTSRSAPKLGERQNHCNGEFWANFGQMTMAFIAKRSKKNWQTASLSGG
jgi:hypothetical protein